MIFVWSLLAGVILFSVYAVIPTYYNKKIHPNLIRHAQGKDTIMLTFDDGPDERYTGKLLDILKENGIKATFFVVADNVRKYPQMVDRMMEEGHCIGIHSYCHKNAWLKTPREEKRDFENSIDLLESYNWKTPFYRPPWGHTNLLSMYYAKKHGFQVMLWSVMAQDWSSKSSKETIIKKLLERTREHSIICLHDAGENSGGAKDAPLNTIEALKTVIPILKQKGYRFVTPEVAQYEAV